MGYEGQGITMFIGNKKLSEIVEISLLTNRWCMWADSSLPGHETYVPAVFQTRDAFYHFIDLVATGIGPSDAPGVLQSEDPEKICEFWSTDQTTLHQYNEILHHISRAFFDVVDHICIQLIRQKKPSGSSDCYLWYDKQLKFCSISAQKLREEKSHTSEKTLETVRKWDLLLHHITSAYMLAEQHAKSEDAILSVHKLFKRIEAKHSQETLEKACSDYWKLKLQFEHIVSVTDIPKMIVDLGKKISELIEDETRTPDETFIMECEQLKDTVERTCTEHYHQLAHIYQRLDDVNRALYSTTHVQKVKKRTETFSKSILSVIQMVIAALPTYLIEKYLFRNSWNNIVPSITQILNDNVVVLLLLYICVLILIHLIFKGANWGIWHIYTNWKFRQLRKKVRAATPEWIKNKSEKEATHDKTSSKNSDK